MQAGQMRGRAEIKTPSTTKDTFGQTSGFVSLGTFRCEVSSRSIGEDEGRGITTSRVRYFLTFRHQAALASLPLTAQVILNGRTLEVLTVEPKDARNRDILIVAEERAR